MMSQLPHFWTKLDITKNRCCDYHQPVCVQLIVTTSTRRCPCTSRSMPIPTSPATATSCAWKKRRAGRKRDRRATCPLGEGQRCNICGLFFFLAQNLWTWNEFKTFLAQHLWIWNGFKTFLVHLWLIFGWWFKHLNQVLFDIATVSIQSSLGMTADLTMHPLGLKDPQLRMIWEEAAWQWETFLLGLKSTMPDWVKWLNMCRFQEYTWWLCKLLHRIIALSMENCAPIALWLWGYAPVETAAWVSGCRYGHHGQHPE